jgi:nitric oxide reductase activation protein
MSELLKKAQPKQPTAFFLVAMRVVLMDGSDMMVFDARHRDQERCDEIEAFERHLRGTRDARVMANHPADG